MIAACAALALAGCARTATASRQAAAPPRVPVEVAALARRDLVETVNLVGSIAATETAELRAEIAGVVREIAVEEGQPVRKGDLLVKIDDAEIAAQADEAQSAYELAELSLKRNRELARMRNLAQADLDRAEAEFRAAKARWALQRTRLAKTSIRAPFDGIVGARSVSPGDYITSTTVIARIDDLSRLKVEFDVPESFMGRIGPGTVLHVLPVGMNPVAGEVFFVSASISRATRSGTAKAFLAKPPSQLKPGMFATVELVISVHPGVLVVPESAVLVTGSGTQIVLAREHHAGPADATEEAVADFVAVRLGIRSKGLVEVAPVRGELNEGDAVVASGVGAIALYQDARLKVKPLRRELRLGD